jgi:signal peptidase I
MTEETPRVTGAAAPSSVSEEDGDGGSSASRRADRDLRWLIGPAVLLLVVVLLRAFLLTPFGIPSRSMEDTLLVGDRILVTRTTSPDELVRGDLIVFDASDAFNLDVPERGVVQSIVDAFESIVGRGQPTDYVKRVIGLPGDRVRCCAADGRLEVNGDPIDEPYVKPGQEPSTMTFDVLVPPDRFWVMGDNRGGSADSRAHLGEPGGGMVPGGDIIGKVWVRYWPLDRLGTLDS